MPEIICNGKKIELIKNTAEIPTRCPDCGILLDNDGIRLMCRNEGCPSRTFQRIMNWIKVVTIDGMGEALVDKLFNAGPEREGRTIVKGIYDLYRLTVEDIASVEGWGKKSATTIIGNINRTRHLKPAKFLAAVGIPSISHRTAEDLIKAFGSIDKVLQVTKEDVSVLKGYSEVSATAIVKGLRMYGDQIRKLMTVIDLSPVDVSVKLAGMTFCFTGAMSQPRNVYQEYVIANGGINFSTVTKDLNYLVCNEDKGSSKSQKALKYGTKIITEQEFLTMVEIPDKEKAQDKKLETLSLFQ